MIPFDFLRVVVFLLTHGRPVKWSKVFHLSLDCCSRSFIAAVENSARFISSWNIWSRSWTSSKAGFARPVSSGPSHTKIWLARL